MKKPHEVKLGELIEDGDQLRDAVHIAVFPAMAEHKLVPGERICVNAKTGLARVAEEHEQALGIVDPFLEKSVRTGQRFWVFLMPQTITSLRHMWTHPEFEDEFSQAVAKLEKVSTNSPAEQWIRDFVDRHHLHVSYEGLIGAAEQWANCEDYTYDNSESYKGIDDDEWRLFWKFYQELRGPVANWDTGYGPVVPFTCSC